MKPMLCVHCGILLAEVLFLIQKHYFLVPGTFFSPSHAVLQEALGMACKAYHLLYKVNLKNWFFYVWRKQLVQVSLPYSEFV